MKNFKRSGLSLYLALTLSPLILGSAGTFLAVFGWDRNLFIVQPLLSLLACIAVMTVLLYALAGRETPHAWSVMSQALSQTSLGRKTAAILMAFIVLQIVLFLTFVGSLSSLYSGYQWFAVHLLSVSNASTAAQYEQVLRTTFLILPLIGALPAALVSALRVGLRWGLLMVGQPRAGLGKLPLSLFLVGIISLPGLLATGFDIVALFFLH